MGAETLRADAQRHIDQGFDYMPVVVPEGFQSPPKWPRGELLCVNSGGERVYRMNIQRLLKWIDWAEAEDAKG